VWFLPTGLRALCALSTTLRSGAGEDEIERIRREFEDAKRNYLSIPAAIKDMPKMNPQGREKRISIAHSLPYPPIRLALQIGSSDS